MEKYITCPRCGNHRLYFMATSRIDNATELCGPCDNAESILDFMEGYEALLASLNDWADQETATRVKETINA